MKIIKKWYCKKLKKKVTCNSYAIPDPEIGFICDCGQWTNGDDLNHYKC